MKAVKKLTASVLCAAMLASLGGCAFFDSDDEAVLEAADAYASASSHHGFVSSRADNA